VNFGVVVEGRQVEVVLDGGNGDLSGLQLVNGQSFDRNSTTHHGQVLRDDGPNTIVSTVRRDGVEVTCNGQPVIDWKGESRSLSLPHDCIVPDDRRLFLVCWGTPYRITRLELSSPVAEIPTQQPAMPAKTPRSLADLADQPSADKRLPVPAGKDLAMRAEYELQAKYWLDRGLPDDAPTADAARKRVLDKPAATPGISLARIRPGLDMAMFDGADLQQFRARGISEGLCHNFGFRSPHPAVSGDNFSIRWTGWLKPPLPGKYVIKTSSDDGIRVRINGNLVIDHWHRGAGDELVEVELTDQPQPLTVEFNDTGATAAVCVSWALKNLSDFQVVPAEVFFHDPAVVPAK